MTTRNAQRGYTLVELLLGLAIAAIILLPLADMLRTSADSARTVRSRLDLNAEANFAIEKIAARAAAATGSKAPDAASTPTEWLKRLNFEECRNTRELMEGASCSQANRNAIVVANVDKIDLSMPDTATPTLRISLTLSHPDVAEPVTRMRTVRVGAYP